MINLPDWLPLAITTSVLLWVLYSFVREKLPAHITAMTAMAILLTTGVISTNDALAVFSNSAPITIACMFVLSAALEHTGIIERAGYYALKAVEKNRTKAMITLLGGVMVISAFMNNTPVVVVMAPIVIAVARKLQDYPSKYLIPLSYAAILGGTCTMIGTSTNLLVDGVAQNYGQEPFSMFEISGAGICIALAGMVFMALFAGKLLPERQLLEHELIDETTRKRYCAEAVITSGSPLIGKTLNEVQFSDSADYEIIDLVRNDSGNAGKVSFISRLAIAFDTAGNQITSPTKKASSPLRDIPLQAGDRLVFKTHKNQLLELRKTIGIRFDHEEIPLSTPLHTRETMVAEGVIGVNSPLIGRNPAQLRLRRRYGCYILAMHRDSQHLTGKLDELILRYGDVLLLEGPKEELQRLFQQEGIMSLSQQMQQRHYDKRKAPIAMLTLLAVVVLAAFEAMPIAGLSLIGAMVVILSGCVSQKKAYESIEWSILLLIFGMLSLSAAMEQTGLAKHIVEYLALLMADYGPFAAFAMLYLVTSSLTEIMSNNATAVLLTPIAIGLAESLGVDPRPFIVAVMFGASASFATPIGYQTNTYVYNAGNYRFSDFLRIGLPMNMVMFIVSVMVIPLFWEF